MSATAGSIVRTVWGRHDGLMDWKRLGRRIRAVWRASGVSQTKIVKELHIERQTMGAWMRGDRHPTSTNLERLADVIGAELVIDFVHPNEPKATTVATHAGIEAAQIVDELTNPGRLLRLLRVAGHLGEQDWAVMNVIVDFHQRRNPKGGPETDPEPTHTPRS